MRSRGADGPAQGYSLTESVATMMPESMQAGVDYHQILVPVVGSHVTEGFILGTMR